MCLRPLFVILALFLTCVCAGSEESAKHSFSSFVDTESILLRKEQRLSRLAEGLGEWVRGRSPRDAFSALLNTEKKALNNEQQDLPAHEFVHRLVGLERDMVLGMERLSSSETPNGSEQKQLFSLLNKKTQERTQVLLDWRYGRVVDFLSRGDGSVNHMYFRWEASWHPIWQEENRLAARLQSALLDESTDDHKTILRALLRLRLRASHIAAPGHLSEIQKLAQERLAILARTGAQLVRLDDKKSRGTITQVRRLSRQLSALTDQFQVRRLSLLEGML